MAVHQAPQRILMVRPASFGFNQQTFSSNPFQQLPGTSAESVVQNAIKEFNNMVDLLGAHKIDVQVFDDTAIVEKPDAVFPNNWITLHPDGRIIIYPMMALNRRAERRVDVIESLRKNFVVTEIIDLSHEEYRGRYLEGTGSLVLDYVNKIIYASRSERTNEELVHKVAQILDYRALVFNAVDQKGLPVYHTNVVMGVGTRFVVICLDAIHSEDDQERLLSSFAATGHKVVAISYQQMLSFAGNLIEVRNRKEELLVLLSSRAFNSLLPGQIDAISRYAEMIPIPIDTIERHGGGSVRCMVAGNYLPG
jgi:hypothetical protein